MSRVERICAKCGTSNNYDRASCSRCGTNLVSLPAPRQDQTPARWEGPTTAALLIGASAWIARTGIRLFVGQVLPRMVKAMQPKPASHEIVDQAVEQEPDYTIRGWRAWSYRRGSEQSTGSEHFEWRIRREPQARRPKDKS